MRLKVNHAITPVTRHIIEEMREQFSNRHSYVVDAFVLEAYVARLNGTNPTTAECRKVLRQLEDKLDLD